jgi:hypothetical protein
MLHESQSFLQQEQITNKLKEKYFHFLKFSNLHAEVVCQTDLESLLPELFEEFTRRNWVFDIARIFVIPGNMSLPIHIDGNKEHPKYWALNIPIFNSENSKMHWWQPTANKSRSILSSTYEFGNNIKVFDSLDDCVQIESCVINVPTCVRIDIPHSVTNYSDQTRVLISVRFKDLLHWNHSH